MKMSTNKAMAVAIVIMCLLVPLTVNANEAVDLPNKFMSMIDEGDGGKAVDEYFSSNPLIFQKAQEINYLKIQVNSALELFGEILGFEQAIVDDLSSSVKRFVYITKHEYHLLTWEFYVYKPRDTWIASNMKFSDTFDLLESKK